jgi:hypothetical protein
VRLVPLSAICAFLLAVGVAHGAGLETPRLSDDLTTQKYFDPDRLLTAAGLKYEATPVLTLLPQFGLGHDMREQETGRGHDEVVHKFNVRAGGEIELSSMLYLSAAAKLPVYTYETTERRLGGDISFQSPAARYDYDLFRRPLRNLSWTGEVGIRLDSMTDLNLFYDQTQFGSFQGGSRFDRMEEKFGTRIIFRFW